MNYVRFDDFANTPDNHYPYSWKVEKNCENSNRLGAVRNRSFQIFSTGNKHSPNTPPLLDFVLETTVRGDEFFSPFALRIFFRYDFKTRRGLCLEYLWGNSHENTIKSNLPVSEYTATLFLYDGNNFDSHFERIVKAEIPAFLEDMSEKQTLKLTVKDNHCILVHNGRSVAVFDCKFAQEGEIAFDRSPGSPMAFSVDSVKIEAEIEDTPETVVIPEHTVEFPAGINGIVNPVYYHYSIVRRNGQNILKTGVSGGPLKVEPYNSIRRFRLGEVLTSPYIRLERSDGFQIDTFYIRHGTVGLTKEWWNTHCTVYFPTEYAYPADAEFVLEELPENVNFILGYEEYKAEDSISRIGGPTETLLDKDSNVIYAGKPLGFELILESDPNKKVVSKIPEDIIFHDEAVHFARRNFFYYPDEEIKVTAVFVSRFVPVRPGELSIRLELENAFMEKLEFNTVKEPVLNKKRSEGGIPGFQMWEACFTLPHLQAGVYHLAVNTVYAGVTVEIRHAMEVMTLDILRTPPVVSGLPALYSNIISGIKSEHFYPWSPTVNDVMHYQTGSSLFLKVANEWKPWRLVNVYGRPWLCWIHTSEPFRPGGVDANPDLVAASDYVSDFQNRRSDCWSIPHYGSPRIRKLLIEFIQRPEFKVSDVSELAPGKISPDPAVPITEAQFRDLVDHHWQDWLAFIDRTFEKDEVAYHEKLKRYGAKRFYAFCSPVYPTYGSVYKSDYFLLSSCGNDPQTGIPIHKFVNGPNGFEDYPYSSKYPIARGVFQMAALKLTDPELPLNPEAFGINGETADSHVTFAHPPYGVSSPPSGFYEKLFYEYSYGVCWFRDGAFSFWNDHGYHIRGWEKHHYADMFKAYRFIRRHKPVKPLKTMAFVLSIDACKAHPEYYEKDPDLYAGGYTANTAEEDVPFAYEEACRAGLTAGFLTRAEDLERLNSSDVSLLVLPPLKGIPSAYLDAIRKLHKHGVSLLSFEDPGTLSDLFGTFLFPEERPVRKISPTALAPELSGLVEYTGHPLAKVMYGTWGDVLLESEGTPVLSRYKTKWGLTAFFHLPPGRVRIARDPIASYGQKSMSVLMNRATSLIMEKLASGTPVSCSEGKAIAFMDEQGETHVIVSEDTWPDPGRTIHPLVKIDLPDMEPDRLSCNVPFSLIKADENGAELKLTLGEHQSALIQIKSAP